MNQNGLVGFTNSVAFCFLALFMDVRSTYSSHLRQIELQMLGYVKGIEVYCVP